MVFSGIIELTSRVVLSNSFVSLFNYNNNNNYNIFKRNAHVIYDYNILYTELYDAMYTLHEITINTSIAFLHKAFLC